MGIFFNEDWELSVPSFLNEFETDGQKYTDDEEDEYKVDDDTEDNPDDGEEEPATDDEGTEDGADEYTLDADDIDGNEGTPEQEPDGNVEDQPEDTGTDEDEYTLNDEEDTGGDEEGTEENNPDDGEEEPATAEGEEDGADDGDEYSLDDSDESSDGNEEDSAEGEESDTDSNLKQLEGELFDQLSPEQQTIKINELKKCFQELYERCDNLIQLLNDVSAPDENSSKVFEYLNDNLIDLKQYIYDYFTYTFETKLYIENSAQYQKYIALLNSLNGVLEELKKSKQE